jgi:MoxR-like ATPase
LAVSLPPLDISVVRGKVGDRIVGRERETEVVLAALDAGCHLVLEGPPGPGKSTLLRAVADSLALGFEFVEGNAELTPARLVGHFDPARVLADGYDPDVFVDGPLVSALRDGSLLYIEELNRVPEETLNVLITVMSERELHVPRLGRVVAAPGFRLVAAMNPFDVVGTGRISGAMYDRVCRVRVDYQDAEDELAIVARSRPDADLVWAGGVVEVVRRTRDHADLLVGSSVRGALDTTAVACSLAQLRGSSLAAVGLDAALVALSGRVRVREGSGRRAEDIITELWAAVFREPDRSDGEPAAPGDARSEQRGKAHAPPGPASS